MKNTPINVVALFISVNNEILLCKRSDTNLYSIAGGKVESKEELKDALKREIQEELSLNIDLDKLQSLSSLPANQDYPTFTFHLFLLNLSEKPKIILNQEHTHFLWSNPKSITVKTMPRFNLALKEYYKHHDSSYD